MQQLSQWLERVASLRVMVLGDAMLDQYVIGDCRRISAEAPVPVVRWMSEHAMLGGAANVAANAAALGARTTMVTVMGRDEAGATLSELCTAHGLRLLALNDSRPTTRKVRIVAQQQQMLRLDYEEPSPICADVEEGLLAWLPGELPSTDVVIVSDYAKGVLTERVCHSLMEMALVHAVPVLVDPRPQHASWYRGCAYITPNWGEAHAILGEPEPPIERRSIERAGWKLRERFACTIVLTLGDRGIACFEPGRDDGFTIPAEAKELADVSGAGDTVAATFALALAAGYGCREALNLANRAAGVAVGRRGTAIVTAADLWPTPGGAAGDLCTAGHLIAPLVHWTFRDEPQRTAPERDSVL